MTRPGLEPGPFDPESSVLAAIQCIEIVRIIYKLITPGSQRVNSNISVAFTYCPVFPLSGKTLFQDLNKKKKKVTVSLIHEF